MKNENIWKIDIRENYGFVDSWTEYLCVETINADTFVISVKTNVIIDSLYNGELLAQFYDEDEEDYVLPDEINGHKILGWNADCLLSTQLENNFQYEPKILPTQSFESPLKVWMNSINWEMEEEHSTKINSVLLKDT